MNEMRIFTSLSFVALLFGCDKDVHDHPDLVSGKQLFEHHCSSCHKDTGQGQFLKGIPANRGTELSIEQIFQKITSAKKDGHKMLTLPNMGKEESEKISLYLKSL